MKNLILITAIILSTPIIVQAQNSEEVALKNLVNTFLENVSSKDMHDRFWAEDLIYTSSSGKRHGKETIMAGFSKDASNNNNTSGPSYSAEDMVIRVFENMAVVTFRLVSMNVQNERIEYLNSGTFIKRNNEWKVINWQATKAAKD